MKLSKVDITHFRCFKSLSIPLCPDVNVIVGVNGSGKTAILDALAISLFHVMDVMLNQARHSYTRHPQPPFHTLSDIYLASDSDQTKTKEINSVRLYSEATDFYPLRPHNHNLHNPPLMRYWKQEITYTDPNRFTSRTEEDLEDYFKCLWPVLRETPEAQIPLPVVAYYRATRRISKMPEMSDIFNVRMDRESAFDHALDAGEDYQSMCQWFYLRENQELRERQYKNLDKTFELPDLKAARQALFTLVEGVDRIFFDGMPPTLKIALTQPGQTMPIIVTLEQLSDGYRNLLALVLDFARRLALANPYWENPLTAPGILLIDEMDLHLHPKWQQRVIPDLRKVFPNTQLIVTTHSPQILTTVRPENILVLKNQMLFSPPVNTYGAESSRALQQVMETESRPDNAVSAAIKNLFELIHQKHYDAATKECKRLMAEMGTEEPVLLEAEMIIKNRVWEQELGL